MISVSEVLLVAVVSLLAFGPKHLPGLIATFARAFKKFHQIRDILTKQWAQFLNEQQLIENQAKATEAEKHYQQQDTHHE